MNAPRIPGWPHKNHQSEGTRLLYLLTLRWKPIVSWSDGLGSVSGERLKIYIYLWPGYLKKYSHPGGAPETKLYIFPLICEVYLCSPTFDNPENLMIIIIPYPLGKQSVITTQTNLLFTLVIIISQNYISHSAALLPTSKPPFFDSFPFRSVFVYHMKTGRAPARTAPTNMYLLTSISPPHTPPFSYYNPLACTS